MRHAEQDRNAPVKSYTDPRIDIYAPTGTSPYYRIYRGDGHGRRLVDTTGGRTLRSAQDKARKVAVRMRRRICDRSRDPRSTLVHREVEQWLDPDNHRTRGNRVWTRRHADNVAREWRLRMAPHIPTRATIDQIDDKPVWVRILNAAQDWGLSPTSVQKPDRSAAASSRG